MRSGRSGESWQRRILVGEYVRVAGSDKYIGGATVGREDHFWRVNCEYAMYGVVCWKLYYWHPRGGVGGW
jgi:hypothetical protein